MCKAKQILSLLSTLLLFSFATVAMEEGTQNDDVTKEVQGDHHDAHQDDNAQEPQDGVVVVDIDEPQKENCAHDEEQQLDKGTSEPEQQKIKDEPEKKHSGAIQQSPRREDNDSNPKKSRKRKCTIQ